MALGDCWKQLSWFYYQYLLVTALYMLEPWERTVFSILFFAPCSDFWKVLAQYAKCVSDVTAVLSVTS